MTKATVGRSGPEAEQPASGGKPGRVPGCQRLRVPGLGRIRAGAAASALATGLVAAGLAAAALSVPSSAAIASEAEAAVPVAPEKPEAPIPGEKPDVPLAAALPYMPDITDMPAHYAMRYPRVLGPEDAQAYAEIFALQENGRWAAADRRIGKITDRVLLGHVMAQRYLHPTAYRSKFSELRDWLDLYADHPDALRIYKLALRRKPANARRPDRPRDRFAEAVEADFEAAGIDNSHYRPETGYERSVRRHIGRNVAREYLTVSQNYLNQASVARRLGPEGVDRMRAIVAGGWFRRGDTAKAWKLAADAAKRSGLEAPRAAWWAGMAAFRLGNHDDARRHFEIVAESKWSGPEDEARGAFWAARAALRAGDMERVGPLMERAASQPRTFYGRIAGHIRAKTHGFTWAEPEALSRDLAHFATLQAGRRVLALIQVGEEVRAEAELRTLRVGLSPDLLRTVAVLADAADMPGTALRAGRVLMRATGERLDSALYPLPHWVPEGGYLIDRALLYALARQESAFNVNAVSHAGARGLLQLMPATARYMAGESFRGRHRHKLYEPRLNLALGQKYVDYLLKGDIASNNLVLALASYNGGPGNVAKWRRKIVHDSDPLVFIETIPARETRHFVKTVLSNLWAYRARLSQGAPSLDALAGGRWPTYVGLDGAGLGVAEERQE